MEMLFAEITEKQKENVIKLAENAFDRVIADNLIDKHRINKLIKNGNEFQADIVALIMEYSLSNQFADEELPSNYVYPEKYKGPKPINEQIKEIANIFGLDPSKALKYVKNLPVLPKGSEGWFAIPRWQMIAPTYVEAVEKVFEEFASKQEFYNGLDDQLGMKYLRQHARTVKLMEKLVDIQNHADILIVPAQFGLRHKGRSVNRAREIFVSNEFGLGAFAVGIMLLTHPERVVHGEQINIEQLYIDCAGDEFAPNVSGLCLKAPVFYLEYGTVCFEGTFFGNCLESFGSASAFLPHNN